MDEPARLPALSRAMPMQAALLLAVAVGYGLLATVGFEFSQFSGNVSPVWPAAGLAVAAGILLGRKGVLAVFPAAWAVHAMHTLEPWPALAIAIGNTLEAAIAAWVVRSDRLSAREVFHAPRGAFRFAAGVLMGAWSSALIGVTTLWAVGDVPSVDAVAAAITWYLGDVTGALVVAPVIVLGSQARPRIALARLGEGVVVLSVLAGVALLVFTGVLPLGWSAASLSVLCVPPLVWAAFRLGPTFSAVALLGVDAVAIAATLAGSGPFQAASLGVTIALLQVFVGTMSLLLIPLAALADEGRRSSKELERRVLERTAALEALNATLRVEVEQRRQADARAEEAERIAFMGSWRWDLKQQRLSWSSQLYRLFGYEPGQPPTMQMFMERVHPDDRVRVEHEMQFALVATGRFHSSYRAILPDGRQRILTVDGIAETGPDGPTALVGVTRDVTDQAAQDRALRESLDRFQALADGSPVGVFHTDAAGRLDYANGRWHEISGSPTIAQEDVIARVHPEDRARILAKWEAAVAAGTELVADFRYVHDDGKARSCVIRSLPVVGPDGKPTGFVGVLEDVTARRDAEAKELELRRLAEQAAFKTNFLRTAAHELGTPITPLRIQVRILKGLLADGRERERKSVDILDRNVERLSLLVRDLLESARLQSGRMRLVARPMDLAETVHDVMEAFQDQAIQSGVVLDLRGPSHAPVEADPDRLTQVLFNLLSNAMKFTPAGGRVHVELDHHEDAWRIQVQDSGAGLDPAQASQLFQPFVQVHDEMRMPRGGSGLGLYISRGIVEQHGGTLACHSDGPGKGATFTIRLPAKAAPQPGASERAAQGWVDTAALAAPAVPSPGKAGAERSDRSDRPA